MKNVLNKVPVMTSVEQGVAFEFPSLHVIVLITVDRGQYAKIHMIFTFNKVGENKSFFPSRVRVMRPRPPTLPLTIFCVSHVKKHIIKAFILLTKKSHPSSGSMQKKNFYTTGKRLDVVISCDRQI